MSTAILAALLGILQGLTEFLPISSTAHLYLASRVLGYNDPAFIVLIQFGSILAVMWLYRQRIAAIVAGLPSSPDARRFAVALFAAFLPAVVAGAFLSDFVHGLLSGESFAIIATTFIVGGIVMLAVERFRPDPVVTDVGRIPLGRAIGVGCFQVLALVPGVSRSGATIVGGMLLGLDRTAAAEFSFFLAMPTMFAAFVHDMWEVRHALAPERALDIGVGFTMAFVAAALVVRPFLRYVGRAGFKSFAWYRIVFGVALFVALAASWL